MVWSGQTMRLILVEGHVELWGDRISLNTLTIIAVCSLAIAAIHLVVANTKLGIAMRAVANNPGLRSEEHTSELQSLMRISYAVFCLKKTNSPPKDPNIIHT